MEMGQQERDRIAAKEAALSSALQKRTLGLPLDPLEQEAFNEYREWGTMNECPHCNTHNPLRQLPVEPASFLFLVTMRLLSFIRPTAQRWQYSI